MVLLSNKILPKFLHLFERNYVKFSGKIGAFNETIFTLTISQQSRCGNYLFVFFFYPS